MRQPGGRTISVFAILGVVCLLVILFNSFFLFRKDIIDLRYVARSEESQAFYMRGMTGRVKENFSRDVRSNLAFATRILRLKEKEENLIRIAGMKEEELKGENASDAIGKRLSAIPYRFFHNIKGVEKLRKAGWIVSIICFRIVVLKLSWVLWVVLLPLVIVLGELRRQKVFVEDAYYSSRAFHYSKGLIPIFLIGIPLGYLTLPFVISVAMVLYSWVLLTTGATYFCIGNWAKRL